MVYNETCSCGNKVTVTTSESGSKADGGNQSYIIKCSKCHSDVRTISSSSLLKKKPADPPAPARSEISLRTVFYV